MFLTHSLSNQFDYPFMSNQGNNAPGGFIVKAITGATVAAASYVVFRYFTRTFESAPPIQSNASTLPISLQNLEHNIPISKTGTELPWYVDLCDLTSIG